MRPLAKRRFFYAILAIIIIVVGLFSRLNPSIPAATGDALWAMMVFCCFRFLLVDVKLGKVAAVSLLAAYLVEFSQLIRWPGLVELRSTTLGHLTLGQGFLWSDLVAYTIGIALIFGICFCVERKWTSLSSK